jgi:hypothetical protein
MFARAVKVPPPSEVDEKTCASCTAAELGTMVKPSSKKKVTAMAKQHALLRKSLRVSAEMGSNRWFPLPKTLRAELAYSELGLSVNPGAGTLASYVFSANGLYDPNITGSGHQPKGWDQLIALYDHAIVESARIDVKFAPPDNALICGVNVSGTTSVTYTSAADYLELPHCKWDMTGIVSTYGKYHAISLHNEVDIARFLGVDDLTDGREFATANDGNPNEDVAFHIWAQSASGGDPGAVYFVPRIVYTVLFVEPRDPAAS